MAAYFNPGALFSPLLFGHFRSWIRSANKRVGLYRGLVVWPSARQPPSLPAPLLSNTRNDAMKKPIIPRVLPSKIEINVGRAISDLFLANHCSILFFNIIDASFLEHYNRNKMLDKKSVYHFLTLYTSFSYVTIIIFSSNHSLLTRQVSANRNKSESFLWNI